MSIATLPEELLREILATCLAVDPADFFRFPTLADGAKPPPRAPGLLRVSRQWRRIGAPLLYAALCLRDARHTAAVAALFRAAPALGGAVVRLRVEGAGGAGLAALTQHTPRVRALFLALDRTSVSDAAHLRAALAQLRPHRLFVVDVTRVVRAFGFFPWAPGTNADAAVGEVEQAIARRWTTLRSVHLGPCFAVSPAMALALDQARQVCQARTRTPFSVVVWDLSGESHEIVTDATEDDRMRQSRAKEAASDPVGHMQHRRRSTELTN